VYCLDVSAQSAIEPRFLDSDHALLAQAHSGAYKPTNGTIFGLSLAWWN
jgi:hypothetical protein